jgi:hypothetical protein
MAPIIPAVAILLVILFVNFSMPSYYYDGWSIKGVNYNRMLNMDFPGNNISTTKGLSRNECASLCNGTPGCKGFVRSSDADKMCWVKSGMDPPGISNSVRSAFTRI